MAFFALMMGCLFVVVTVAGLGELVCRWYHDVTSEAERNLGQHCHLKPFKGTIVWPVSARLTQKALSRPGSKG